MKKLKTSGSLLSVLANKSGNKKTIAKTILKRVPAMNVLKI